MHHFYAKDGGFETLDIPFEECNEEEKKQTFDYWKSQGIISGIEKTTDLLCVDHSGLYIGGDIPFLPNFSQVQIKFVNCVDDENSDTEECADFETSLNFFE